MFNDNISRIALIINKDLIYHRRFDLENDMTPCIVIQVRISPRKNLIIIGFYRQWRLLDLSNPFSSRLPKDQVQRFNFFANIIEGVQATKIPYIIGGDINLDRHLPNNPYNREDI